MLMEGRPFRTEAYFGYDVMLNKNEPKCHHHKRTSVKTDFRWDSLSRSSAVSFLCEPRLLTH